YFSSHFQPSILCVTPHITDEDCAGKGDALIRQSVFLTSGFFFQAALHSERLKKMESYLCRTVDLYKALSQLNSHHAATVDLDGFKKRGVHEATDGDERGRILGARFASAMTE